MNKLKNAKEKFVKTAIMKSILRTFGLQGAVKSLWQPVENISIIYY